MGSNAYPDSSVEIEIWHHTFTNSKGNKYYWDGQFTRTGATFGVWGQWCSGRAVSLF